MNEVDFAGAVDTFEAAGLDFEARERARLEGVEAGAKIEFIYETVVFSAREMELANAELRRRGSRVRIVRPFSEACPNDTDGDGNCGRHFCPHCGDRR